MSTDALFKITPYGITFSAATLVDEELQPGEFKVMLDASGLVGGLYLYRLKAEGFVRTRKLTLLK